VSNPPWYYRTIAAQRRGGKKMPLSIDGGASFSIKQNVKVPIIVRTPANVLLLYPQKLLRVDWLLTVTCVVVIWVMIAWEEKQKKKIRFVHYRSSSTTFNTHYIICEICWNFQKKTRGLSHYGLAIYIKKIP
jgi:hypothetical protein